MQTRTRNSARESDEDTEPFIYKRTAHPDAQRCPFVLGDGGRKPPVALADLQLEGRIRHLRNVVHGVAGSCSMNGANALAFRCGGVVAHVENDGPRVDAISLFRVPRTHRRAAQIG